MSPLNEHKDMIAISAYYKVKAQVDDLQRQLDNARTDWLCETCDGRACEGQRQSELMFAENETLRARSALQGLHLATMADVVLGEDANDRSDDTLVREVCRMAREYAELMPIVEAAKAYVDYDIEGESTLWPEANQNFENLKAAVEARK